MLLGGYSLFVMGYPRSGTTMLMRMLEAAGIEIMKEEVLDRANRYDPHGVAEFKDVATELMEHDSEWTKDKAIKLVTLYTDFFPLDRPARVIFTLRDQTEIITSLLSKKLIIDEDISWSVDRARKFLEHNRIPTLYLHYREVVQYPKTTALQVCDFLELDLDTAAMAAVVDKGIRTKYDGSVGDLVVPDIEDYSKAEIRAITLHPSGGHDVPGNSPGAGSLVREES